MLLRTPRFLSTQARRFSSLLLAGVAIQAAAQNMTVYTDSIQNGWNDWSYFVTVDVNSTAVVHSGTKAMAVSLVNAANAYGALSLGHANINSSLYSNLTFWINGGPTGGQQLRVFAELDTGGGKPAIDLPSLEANTWRQITLSLASLGVANQPNFARFSIQDRSGLTNVPTYYVDDISLVTNNSPPPPILVASPSLSLSHTFNFVLNNGVAGERYVIQASADLINWSPVQTNTLGSSSNSYAFPVPGAMQFYRAQWTP